MPGPRAGGILPGMQRSYAVTWQEAGSPAHSGKLELRTDGLFLEGLANGRAPAKLSVRYEELADLHLAVNGDRLGGRPTLVIERRRGACLRVTSVAEPGIVSELLDALTHVKR